MRPGSVVVLAPEDPAKPPHGGEQKAASEGLRGTTEKGYHQRLWHRHRARRPAVSSHVVRRQILKHEDNYGCTAGGIPGEVPVAPRSVLKPIIQTCSDLAVGTSTFYQEMFPAPCFPHVTDLPIVSWPR